MCFVIDDVFESRDYVVSAEPELYVIGQEVGEGCLEEVGLHG